MKAISVGNTYSIYDDTLKSYSELPAHVYAVRFSKMSGYSLEKREDIEISEEKVYGVHTDKVDKVFKTFGVFNRSLGVLLSGRKGIGKSLFAKLLATKATQSNLPVLIVDRYYPGIATFLESITQECLILFDEFEKTFPKDGSDDGISPQASMLGLFDGLTSGKKLFVITCNDLYNLNDFLVNRPGRFHYHFRFECPSSEEIEEYLKDKLDEEYWGEIHAVVSFAKRIDLNYDCLRSIAFELNTGESFGNAIKDLNILKSDTERYRLELVYDNGMVLIEERVTLDLFDKSGTMTNIWLHDVETDSYAVQVAFMAGKAVYSHEMSTMVLLPENITINYSTDSDDEKTVAKCKSGNILYMKVDRVREKSMHYCF